MATAPAPLAPTLPKEIKLYSHSMLFYWWPVWLIGLIIGALTMFGGERMVIVPGDAEAKRDWAIFKGNNKPPELREGVLFPAEEDSKKLHRHLPPNAEPDDLKKNPELKLHATSRKGYGVIFATVLLVVIFITNVPLRGMLSLVIILLIVLLSVIFALAGLWDRILGTIAQLDIRLTAGGYFFISLGLLGLWAIAIFIFDRQLYITFAPGSMKVCLEIGGGETAYDTFGMVIKKERSDLFRHMIFGLGSGDLVIRTAGAQQHEFQLHNVLFISRKLQMIEQMQAAHTGRTP